jgi:hypothetical protein
MMVLTRHSSSGSASNLYAFRAHHEPHVPSTGWSWLSATRHRAKAAQVRLTKVVDLRDVLNVLDLHLHRRSELFPATFHQVQFRDNVQSGIFGLWCVLNRRGLIGQSSGSRKDALGRSTTRSTFSYVRLDGKIAMRITPQDTPPAQLASGKHF